MALLDKWRNSKYYRGELAKWIDVNPTTKIPILPTDSPVSFVPMEAVGEKDGSINTQTTMYGDVSVGYTRFAENDVIWAKITPCMQNGKAAVVRGLIGDIGFGSTEFHVLRPKSDEVLPDFLLSILTLDEFLTVAQAVFSGSAGQQRVPDTFLKTLPLPLPPLDVQRAMVADIQAAREHRAEHLRAADSELANIGRYVTEALRIELFNSDTRSTYAVRLKDARKAGRLNADYFHPERINALRAAAQHEAQGLRSPCLSEIVTFEREQTTADAHPNYLGLAHVQSNTGELVASEETAAGACFRFQADDVLFARLRPYLNKVYRAEQEGVCSTEFYVLRIRPEAESGYKILPEYLATLLRSNLTLAQTRHMMTGNTHPRLANEDVVNLVLPIPEDMNIQEQIAAEVQRRREVARELREIAVREWEAAKAEFERRLLGVEV